MGLSCSKSRAQVFSRHCFAFSASRHHEDHPLLDGLVVGEAHTGENNRVVVREYYVGGYGEADGAYVSLVETDLHILTPSRCQLGPHKVSLSHFQVVAISEPSGSSCCPSSIAIISTQFENEVRLTCIFRQSQSETI